MKGILLAFSHIINLKEQRKVLDYIVKHPSKEGYLAKKAYNRLIVITLLILFFVMIPLVVYTVISFSGFSNDFGNVGGYTKKVNGHISLYKDTFWYTDNNQKYEFSFDDYYIDDTYDPGENVVIYLDNNDDVVSVAHQKKDSELVIDVILVFVIPILLLLLHAFIGRYTYCKWWNLYIQWYKKEIEPYYYQKDFEKIVANKTFYYVMSNIKDLSLEEQRLYRCYRNKRNVYSILLLICIILTVYICIKFNLNINDWFVMVVIVIYVLIFYFLVSHCDAKIEKIKSGYYNKNKK